MLYIEKKPCPPDIQAKIDRVTSSDEYKKLPEVNAGKSTNKKLRDMFNKLDKEKVRVALLKEQGYLCAYCMARIKNDGNVTTIEHFYPLSRYKSRAIDYSNYMAVCNGGRNAKKNGRKKVQCCDASKGNTVVELNPHIRELVEPLGYDRNGRIYTDYGDAKKNEQIQKEIDEVFVLNGRNIDGNLCDTSTYIVKHRKDAYRALDDILLEERMNGTLTREKLEARIRKLEDPQAEMKQPFMGVDIFLLKQYIKTL